MSNRLEKIAEKKRREASEKQQRDVEQFAQKVAEEVVGKLDGNKTEELKDTVAELATSVAQAVVASNKTFDSELKDSFTQLLTATKKNRPDTSNVELSKKIAVSLASIQDTLETIEFSPTINLEAVTRDELKMEIDKIVSKIPRGTRREVALAYDQATADKYINVRLTDGIRFYSAFSAGGGGGREGGASKVLVDKATTNIIYIGKAPIGTALGTGAWQIKKIDKTVTDNVTITFAAAGAFTATWNNRGSETYS